MQYHDRKRQLLRSTDKKCGDGSDKPSVKEQRLETELTRAKNVITEITAKNMELKGVLGLEGHGKMPAELQQEVHAVVLATKARNGWPVRRSPATLGVSAYRLTEIQAAIGQV